jgi:hypothetical protein
LCSAYVLTAFGDMVMKEYMDFTIALLMGEDRAKVVINLLNFTWGLFFVLYFIIEFVIRLT